MLGDTSEPTLVALSPFTNHKVTMKKSLIALAALGTLSSAALAQSSVSIYGLLDIGYGKYSTNAAALANETNKTSMTSNFNSTSHWGLKGTEDLGGGLKAKFQLESAITPETGASSGFNRQSWLGVSGGFGEVRLGNQFSVIDDIITPFDLNGNSNATSAFAFTGANLVSGFTPAAISTFLSNAFSVASIGSGAPYGSPASSQLKYISPSFSGFTLSASAVLKNDNKAFNTLLAQDLQAKNFFQIGGQYENGGLTVAAVVQTKAYGDLRSTATARTFTRGDGMVFNPLYLGDGYQARTSYNVAAKYDFGAVVVSGLWSRQPNALSGNAYGLGIAAPIGAFTVGAQASTTSGGQLAQLRAYEAFGNYAFSKRTSAYINYMYGKATAKNVLTGTGDVGFSGNAVGLGLIHKF